MYETRKSLKSVKSHFIERVKERYDLDIPEENYDRLCLEFKIIYCKTEIKSIGYVFYKENKIWCLYDKPGKIILTAYPKEIENNIQELIRCCLPMSVRHLAILIYKEYIKEKDLISKRTFKSRKDAAKYFWSSTMFPSLHMDNYLYKDVRMFHAINVIRNVIFNKYDFAEIVLTRKIK